MTYFHGICHGSCALRYVGGVLMLRKLNFRGLKGQFGVKKDNFRRLIAKFGHYRLILATRIHLWLIFMKYVIEIGSLSMLERF